MSKTNAVKNSCNGCGCGNSQSGGQSHNNGGGHGHSHQSGGKSEIVKLTAGGAIFAAGIVVPRVFDLHQYAALMIFVAAYAVLGSEIVWRALRNIIRGQVFDENFLMSAATIGAFAIGEYPEAAAVMLFYRVGEYFQGLAVRRSRKSIADLMDIRPDYANIVNGNGDIRKVDPNTINAGDTVIVKPGEKIPLDGVVISGDSLLDTAALTGESVPRKAAANDTVLSGFINQNGVLTIRVTKTFGESTAAKILDLVENASNRKAPTENFITTFSRYYTPAVVILSALIAAVPPLILNDGSWSQWVHRGLVFLVISCPCALVISIPLSFFGGIGGASKRGVLVKGGNYLEALDSLDIVAFDKTGTLTKGVFEVTGIEPSNDFTKEKLLALAATAEAFSNHPIAQSIQRAYGGNIDKSTLAGYNEIAGHGVSVASSGKIISAGNGKLMEREGVSFVAAKNTGTNIYIAVDKMFAGHITISDEIKPDSRAAVAALKSRGVRKTVMLTGDNSHIAKTIAEELRIDEVHSELLPDQKIEKLEALDKQKRPKGKLAFVGDGINDAPVLARADVGVAMGALGSDAAIEAADVVLLTDEPSKLAEAVDIARFTKRVVRQNIVFALGAKALFLALGAAGIAAMWEAVFADVGVALLAVLNASRVGKSKVHKDFDFGRAR